MAGREKAILAVLFVGVLLAALDIAIVGPALPAIRATFAVAPRWLPAVFSVYVLFYVIGTPLLAKRSDRHGRRRVFLESLGVFAVGSLIAAAASSFPMLLLGRAVQAFGAGGLLPVAAAVIAETVPLERRGLARLRQPRQVGEAALRDQLARELVVEPVEPEHNHLASRRLRATARGRREGDGETQRGAGLHAGDRSAEALRHIPHGAGRHHTTTANGRPSMCAGGSMPNNRSAVGARSTMCGSSASIFLLQNSTPGTSRGSMQ
jgi:hypothetical protein